MHSRCEARFSIEFANPTAPQTKYRFDPSITQFAGALSDDRSDLAGVSLLVDVVKESADRGHYRRRTRAVDQVEAVSHAR